MSTDLTSKVKWMVRDRKESQVHHLQEISQISETGKIESGGGNVWGHYQYVQCPTVYGDAERWDICI